MLTEDIIKILERGGKVVDRETLGILRDAVSVARHAADGGSGDDEHDALVELMDAVEGILPS